MLRPLLNATALALSLCGAAAAQQGFLVRHDDSRDPCRRFKMRVLVPAEVAGRILRPEVTAEGIDQRMVWNPCRAEVLQLVQVQPAMPIVPGEGFLAPPRLMLEATAGEAERRRPSESRRPRPARGFELKRGRQK